MREFECGDLEAVLREGDAAELADARRHARDCDRCRKELEVLDLIAEWARGRRAEWDSPGLWERIERKLKPRVEWRWLAVAALVLFAAPVVWLALRPAGKQGGDREFLTSQALEEIESNRASYAKSIERLEAVAEPVLKSERLPVMASYREKLLLLDQAIAEARLAAGQNGLNVQVQTQLAQLYDEKQRTLREVISYADAKHHKL
ncbi:MAG: hypothetical protein HZB13_09255 [Acidobacteria bacterium]|nr:hypothetical protein [Acidobacteriota bacterium]